MQSQSQSQRSSTPTKRLNAVIQSPSAAATSPSRQTTYTVQNSPPSTSRARKDPPSSYPKSARLTAATKSTSAFGSETRSDVDEDHHDLTYTSRHVPRASMVDNLVLSLDQFSNPTIEHRQPKEEDRSYRIRGHTHSSSASSEGDVRVLASKSATLQPQEIERRNSVRQQQQQNNRDPQKLPSIFGEDEDSIRTRVYEAQRAGYTIRRPRQQNNTTAAASEYIDLMDDPDLAHLKHLQGKLGPPGNRRSRSFDFTSRRTDDRENDLGVMSSIAGLGSPSPAATGISIQRRNSARSVKTGRSKPSTFGPSITTTGISPGHLTEARQPPAVQIPEYSTISRPGLFRRFFGSSSRSLASSASPSPGSPVISSDRLSQDQALTGRNNLQAITTNNTVKGQRNGYKESFEGFDKENVPALNTKKSSSSFFRRRKKSIALSAPPPLPLTLQNVVDSEVRPGEPSPVSSLKAFMNPYLETGSPQDSARSPTSPLQKFYTPNIEQEDDPPTPPEKDVELEKTEEPAATRPLDDIASMESTTPTQKFTSTHHATTHSGSSSGGGGGGGGGGGNYLRIENSRQPGPRAASSNAAYPTIRPVVEIRSTSLTDRPGIPLRKESLNPVDGTVTTSSVHLHRKGSNTDHQNKSNSDVSDYKSAPSTPAPQDGENRRFANSPRLHVSHPSESTAVLDTAELDQAQGVYNNGDEPVDGHTAAEWLGEASSERERIRTIYMNFFDWTGHNILAALRSLCSRLALKAESQLIDRILDAFARRWCRCNPTHGFKSSDVVHTICYSILLLNTDLHMADIGSKMTRSQFVKNAMQTIRPVAADSYRDLHSPSSSQFLSVKQNSWSNSTSDRSSADRDGKTGSPSGPRAPELLRTTSGDADALLLGGPLVEIPFSGSDAGWEVQIEAVLKDFYYSIQREPLPLFGSDSQVAPKDNNLLSLGGLRRTPSTLSKAQSESNRSRFDAVSSMSLGGRWNAKARSRPRLGSTPGYGSSKTSLEDQSSAWSPSISSTWSKVSLGKTLTSMSVDSFGTEASRAGGDFQSSIGFASALSQAIIREDQMELASEDGTKTIALLEDESLELEGAPWAKEGIVKHKCHLEGVDKRSKDRNWNDCFAVIERGWMRLFSFSTSAKSMRVKARTKPGAVVGGGNWQDNAEEVWKFMLRHVIASVLPPPGYSKARPHVFALSLPTGAVHLFSVGTPDIVKEFVSAANFWSARLSKEPMIGGISSMEYGWSDAVVNRSRPFSPDPRPSFSTQTDHTRPSTQMSVRSSLEHGSARPRLPGDKIYISEWTPPQQSMVASKLMEADQVKALQTYVKNIEEELQRHNELRAGMLLSFSTKHPNHARAMSNWEKKSAYLLHEIVKFKNYIDALQSAQAAKERIYKMRKEEEENKMNQTDSMAFYATTTVALSS